MALKDSLKKQLNNAKITATKAKDAAVSFSDKITPVIEDKTQQVGERVKTFTDNAKGAVHEKAVAIAPGAVEKAEVAAEKTKELTEKALTATNAAAEKAKDKIVDTAYGISPELVESTKRTAEKVKDTTDSMNLLNSTVKKEAMADLKVANEEYEALYVSVVERTVALHENKVQCAGLIKAVEDFINSIANSPKEFSATISEIDINRRCFENLVADLEMENKKNTEVSGKITGAGILTGAGVAAFGPTVAMAIATTFGTASTGTAIASLTGAAATKAALAWLGGGALASGGAGVAGGKALLALAGPVGWTIGGVAILGGGLLLNSKNKRAAATAEEARKDIEAETNKLREVASQIDASASLLEECSSGITELFTSLSSLDKRDYQSFTKEEKYDLGSLVNNTKTLSELINRRAE